MPAPDWFAELLERELKGWVGLSEGQIDQLRQHYNLLLRWNRRMNLTTVTPGPEMVIRHYCESLFFAAHLPAGEEKISVLDVGSGAGFPGIPMAVLRPDWCLMLVESNQKKAVFLRESTRDLANVTVLAQRIEDVSQTANWLVSRAVDPKKVLAAVPRLAHRAGLMIGEDDFNGVRSDSCIAWAEPVRLPWGDRRICVYGGVPHELFHVKHP